MANVLVKVDGKKLLLAPHVAHDLRQKHILVDTDVLGTVECIDITRFWKELRRRD